MCWDPSSPKLTALLMCGRIITSYAELTAAQSIQYLDKVSFNELCCWIVQPHHAGSIPPSGIPGPNTCLHQVMQQLQLGCVKLCEYFRLQPFCCPAWAQITKCQIISWPDSTTQISCFHRVCWLLLVPSSEHK